LDNLFERMGNLFRTFFEDDEYDDTKPRSNYTDPDMQDAWEELNEYLSGNEQTHTRKKSSNTGYSSTGYKRKEYNRAQGISEELRQDYKNLEVKFGAPFEEVKKAYKNLLREYHPDRHSTDPKKMEKATEITQRINYSFQRIKKYFETGRI